MRRGWALVLMLSLLATACGSIERPIVGGDAAGGAGGIDPSGNAGGAGGSGSGGGAGGSGGSGGAAGCPDDPRFFTERIWEQLLQPKCLTCHTAGRIGEITRLVLVPETDPDWLEKNQAVVREVAQIDFEGEPLLLLKPTGRHPMGHGGGRLVEAGGQVEKDLLQLISWMRGEIEGCTQEEPIACEDAPGRRLLRRLGHREYANTVRDLLGLDPAAADSFAPDRMVHGFSNDADALRVDPLLADQYRAAAEDLAIRAVAGRLDDLLPCHRTEQATCAAAFIHDFGKRAFRRPLATAEQERYAALFREIAADDGFREGLRWVIAAFLQSPHFLYRSELGAGIGDGLFALGPWELATQLSYLFTATMPDDALFEAAATNSLATLEGLLEQVRRLAADSRSDAAMAAFVTSWLQLDRLGTVPRDASTYPELTPSIRLAMQGEIERLAADLVRTDASLGDALSLQYSYWTDELASYYGIEPGSDAADAGGFRRVETKGTPYGGLLKTGAVLVTHALPSSSSPIHRGRLVRERFLCHEIPPPPANSNVSPPPLDPALSTRERYSIHAGDPDCASCHDLVDPIGFAFEHFDGAGRWREKDGIHTIDDTGEILHSIGSDGAFAGMAGLAERLASSDEVDDCFTRIWTTWALGLAESEPHACALRRQLAPGDGIASLRAGLTKLVHFRQRVGAPGEGDAPGPALDPGPVEIDWEPATLAFELRETGRWPNTACFDASVTNLAAEPLRWEVEAQLEGSIYELWNAIAAAGSGGKTSFRGVDWNETLAPDGVASFGFCVRF